MPGVSRNIDWSKAGPLTKAVYGFVFGAAFMSIGLGLILYHSVQLLRARGWTEVPCSINYAKVGFRSSGDSDYYCVSVMYTYEWEGRSYIGERYDFTNGHCSFRSSAEKKAAQYPNGATTVCYVNPRNPGESVLCRTQSLWTYLWGVGVCLFLVTMGGAALVWGGLVYKRGQLPGYPSSPST